MPQANLLLASLIAINLIWLFGITLFLFRAYRIFQKLTNGISKKDFTATLLEIQKHLTRLDGDLDDFRVVQRSTNQNIKSHLQKVGFLRYNPFGNTGGDQSFCLCLLDSQDNGILITSLHARDQTRLYTKQIKKGVPSDKSELSREETKCLKQAIKGGN